LNSPGHGFLASIVGHVGLDPRRDINWVVAQGNDLLGRLVEGKVDATIVAPPLSYEMRAKKIGHVLVNMTTDRPWSQYFCCVLVGNPGFIAANPVASKRVMRAILKAVDLCVTDPAMVARRLVEGKFTADYDYALQALGDVPYKQWRDYDVEDTVRFYALRLREAGAITASPQEIIAKATDWRFLNELKRELKT